MVIGVKEEWIKPVVNITFFLFLCALTIYGLVHITTNPIIQTFIGIIAFVLDAYMLFILSKAKYLWTSGLDINKWKAVGYFIVYGLYTSIYVFLFAVGFYLVEIDTNEQVVQNYTNIQQFNKTQITANQNEIEALTKHLATESNTGYGSRAKELEDKISKLKEENRILSQNYTQTSGKNVNVSKNFLQSLQETFGWSIKTLKIVMFGLLVFLMQFSLISSSFTIKLDNEDKVKDLDDSKKELLKFLDALFDGRNGNALNGVNTISESTGISLDKCIQYRDYLSTLKVNGGYAIAVDKGYCRANYSREFIRNFILSH